MRRLASAFVFLFAVSTSPAAVVSFLNASASDLALVIEHKGVADMKLDLPAGRTAVVRVGREPVLRVTLNGKPAAFNLDPYTPYLFVEDDKRAVTFSGVELAGNLPKPDDVPADPTAAKPLKLPVTLFTDSTNPLIPAERERRAKERFAEAAAVIERQTGVLFEAGDVKEWEADAKPDSLALALGQFEGKAAVKGGRALGFLSRPVKGEELCTPPTSTHALVRDGFPRADAERAEVVTHLLGQWLGAVRSPDGGSVMRCKLGDGRATKSGWVVQFDPHNLIVMHIWAEELAAGRGPKADQFSAKARARLHVLYKSIAAVHDAVKSEDTQARDMVALLSGDPDAAPAVPDVKPVPAVVVEPSNLSDDDKAVRAVVQAVTKKATELAADEKSRPKGDALTAEYVKAAATAAAGLDEKRQARAFLLGLGIALDDSTILRDKPVVKKVVTAAEGEDDRTARLAVLGRPTVRGRRDLCQHFAVSAALTETFGAAAAEFAGMSKELSDMKGTSGFSFADLAADLAGIELANAVTKEPKRVADIAKVFLCDDYVPDITPFAEGLSEAALKKQFGGTDGDKFKAALDDVRKAVKAVPAYRK
jgi:hypothetical protein